MTKPITHRPLKRAGRKPIQPPADAAERVRDLAADGWSVVGIAHRMGVDTKTFGHWLEREPALQDAVDQGRETERHTLHNMLYRKAMEKGDTTAAAIILNARHGYRTDQSDQGRVNVTIALPGAMTVQQFMAIGKVNSNEQGEGSIGPSGAAAGRHGRPQQPGVACRAGSAASAP